MLPLVQSSSFFYNVILYFTTYKLQILNHAKRSVRQMINNLLITGISKLSILHLVSQCHANRRPTAIDNGICRQTVVLDVSNLRAEDFLSNVCSGE